MKINRTAKRTVDMLRLISRSSEGMTLEEICEAMELPKTSAYDIITTLVTTGMAEAVQGAVKRYRIGLLAYRIGIAYKNNLDFMQVIEGELKGFAREIGKTVFFGRRTGSSVVYLCKAEPENPIITTARVGTRNPMYCTSLGKAILANLTQQEQEGIMDRIQFIPHTPYTVCDREKLKEELTRVREQGYALDLREVEEHMVCVGAPVYDSTGLLGAISASSMYREDEDYRALGEKIRKKAMELTRLLAGDESVS